MASKFKQMPYDSTMNSLLGLQTLLARFVFWINLPFCWIVVMLTLTGHLESWRRQLPAEQQYWVSIFAGVMGGWLMLSHTFGVIGAMRWELWWNPYAHHPKLRGKVSAEEEQHLLMMNRRQAKQIWSWE